MFGFGFKTLPSLLITHVHRAPVLSPSHVPCDGKGFQSDKKKKNRSSSEMPPFLLALAKVSRVRKKERKIYRGIKNANRGLRFFASSSSSNKPKRKQTGRCAEAQGLVVVGSKSPKSRRAKRIPFFPSVSPPKAEAAIL